MKRLLAFLPIMLVVFKMFGANPSYDAFVGTNGIVIRTNPPQGRVVVDGRLLTNSFVDVITNRYDTGNIFTNFGALIQSGDLRLLGVSADTILEIDGTFNVQGVISRFLANNFFAMNITNILAASGIAIGTNNGALYITNTAAGSGADGVWTNDGFNIMPRAGYTNFSPLYIRSTDGSYMQGTNVRFFYNINDFETAWNVFGAYTASNSPVFKYEHGWSILQNAAATFYSQGALKGTAHKDDGRGELNIIVLTTNGHLHTWNLLSSPNGSSHLQFSTNANVLFQVDPSGDITTIKDIDYLWPSAQGAAGTVLTNDGTGVLGWGAGGGGGTVDFGDLVWTNDTSLPAITLATGLGTNVVRVGVGLVTNLLYDPNRKSMRMGQIPAAGTGSEYWNITNLGIGSVGFGSNSLAGGYMSSVLGGAGNFIGTNTRFAVIVGGRDNSMTDSGGGLNFIGGGNNNTISAISSNSVIVGGSGNLVDGSIHYATIGGGQNNRVRQLYGTIAGGVGNDTRAQANFIGGGQNNVAGTETTDNFATIAGGDGNQVDEEYTFIGGGQHNRVNTSGRYAAIGGGNGNDANGSFSFIGGGFGNRNENLAEYTFMGGGFTNIIATASSSIFSFILSGVSNRVSSAPLAGIVGSFATNSTPSSILVAPNGTHGSNRMHVTATATTNIGPFEIREVVGRGDGSLKIWQTNQRGFTEFTVTNSVISTNRLVFSFSSNSVVAGEVFRIHSTDISDGVNNMVITNYPHLITNFLQLSVQAAKLPATNYPSIDGGWQAWETVYAETNAEGSRVALDASWQFMVPPDYGTNSLKLLINYSLLQTNGPNTSNVVWGASVLVIRSGTTNNVHTNAFGSVVKGSNDWIAKYDGTNIVTNLVIDLGVNSLLMARDLAVIKLERRPTEDTYGGAVSVHGLQIEYTRP